MSYWDTSTLVKLYAQEPDSPAFESHVANATNPQITSRIALYEARATFRRKEAEGCSDHRNGANHLRRTGEGHRGDSTVVTS